MFNLLPSSVSTLTTMDLRTVISLLIPFVLLGLCIICIHELYARHRARRLPPGVSGLRCLLEIPNERAWLAMLKFNQQYGVLSHASDHEVPLSLITC